MGCNLVGHFTRVQQWPGQGTGPGRGAYDERAVGNGGFYIINHHGQLISHQAVFAFDREIFLKQYLIEVALALNAVMKAVIAIAMAQLPSNLPCKY